MGRDDTWFDALFTTHVVAVHRFIARRASRADVDDLTADVFLTAWRRREQIMPGTELPWLYKTAGFLLANHHRKRTPVPLRDIPETPTEADTAQWGVGTEEVHQVLAQLSSRDQQILLLSAWEGLSGEQLAEVLGVTRGGADAALSRARARLREAWSRVEATA